MILAEYPGVFGYQHILYFICVLAISIVSIILIKKHVKEDKLHLVMQIIGVILLISIIANRISVTYTDVVINQKEGYTWLNIIPYTYCGLCSIVLGFALLFGKKDNIVLQSVYPLSFIGGVLVLIYPDFMNTQYFWEIRTFTGLVHHSISLYAIILAIITGYLKPSIKKWYYFPLFMCIVITFGIFEKDALKFPTAMQLGAPLLDSLPFISSWYFVGVSTLIVYIIFLILYEKCINKSK